MDGGLSLLAAWRVIRSFGLHSFVGTSLFAIVATPAVACDFAVKWLGAQHVSEHVLFGLSGVEMAILASDLVLFGVFILRTSIHHGKLLWHSEDV